MNSYLNKFKGVNLVLGGLGFIGSNLVSEILGSGERCLVVDNEILGSSKFINISEVEDRLEILRLDVSLQQNWEKIYGYLINEKVRVWHLAANSDISLGGKTSLPDYQNTLQTSVLLAENLKKLNCVGLIFASSSAVYGDLNGDMGYREDQMCLPESFYGACKLASEHILQIACERLSIPIWSFRFANIVGAPATHGVIFDLIHKLIKDSSCLQVLGNGEQCKTYMHVKELISLMREFLKFPDGGVWNLGPGDSGIKVKDLAQMVVEHVSPNAHIAFGEQAIGWPGDVSIAMMNCEKMKSVTDFTLMGSSKSVHRAVHEIADQFGIGTFCDSV